MWPLDGKLIGERVRHEREARKWSQRMLAARANISHAYVSHLEAGMYSRPGLRQLEKIAAAFKMPLEELLGVSIVYPTEDLSPTGAEVDPLRGAEINLKRLRDLDPEEFNHLVRTIQAVIERVERQYLDERRRKRARRHGRTASGPAGQDNQEASPPHKLPR